MPSVLRDLAEDMHRRAERYHDERISAQWRAIGDALEQADTDIRVLRAELTGMRTALAAERDAHAELRARRTDAASDAGDKLVFLTEEVQQTRADTREPTTYDRLTRALNRIGVTPRPASRKR